jgi:hypothetical protein
MNFLEIESRIEDLSIGKTKEHLGFTIGTITSYDRDTDYYLTPIRDSHRISYTGVIVRNVETAIEIASFIDGKVAYIFVDTEKKVSKENYGPNDVGNIEKALAGVVKKSIILSYKGNDLTVRAADSLLRVLTPNLSGAKIAVIGVGNIGMKLGLSLLERGNFIYLYSKNVTHAEKVSSLLNQVKLRTTIAESFHTLSIDEAIQGAQVLVATTDKKSVIGTEHLQKMMNLSTNQPPILIDIGKGCYKETVFEAGNVVYRVDVGEELSAEIDLLISQQDALYKFAKSKSVEGKIFIRKGIAGKQGNFVVDSIENPTQLLGECDGLGNLNSVPDQLSEKLLALLQDCI